MALSKINTNSIADDAVTTAKVNPAQTDITSVGTLSSATVSGALSAKGGAVFNEDSADVDFRVESNGNANMLFVDGGNDAVGIGISNPASYNQYADELVVGGADGNRGITIVGGDDDYSILNLNRSSNTSDTPNGAIEYNHSANQMYIKANALSALQLNSDGSVNMTVQPSISVDGNTSPAVSDSGSSSYTITQWTTSNDSVFYSQGITYDSSNGRFTVPVAGKYLINVSIYLYQNGVFQRVQIYVNGSNTLHFTLDNTTGDGDFGQDNSLSGSTIFNLSANDYISFHMYKTGSMATSRYYFGPQHTSASIHLLS